MAKIPFIYEAGPLSVMGYHVGATKGVSKERRRHILRRAMEFPWSSDVTKQIPTTQLKEWGDPGLDRYTKIVKTLTAFIDNAQGNRSSNLLDAIHDWKDDLQWLKEVFGPKYAP